MSSPTPPKPAKLLIGLLSAEPSLFTEVEAQLQHSYGPIDLSSQIFPWEMTNYYRAEMGEHLRRKFISFERLLPPDELTRLKVETNALETAYACPPTPDGSRRINIDPGYMDAAKLVLASTKDQAHRIYLSHGIYAEVTLRYHHGAFRPFEYTYPDYCWPDTHAFLSLIRKRYLEQLRQTGGATGRSPLRI